MTVPEGFVPDTTSAPEDFQPDGVPAGAMTPEQMFGPRAMTQRWMRAIPFATGMGGAMLPPPFGGTPGATIGGISGVAIERGLNGQSLDFRDPAVRQALELGGVVQGALEAPAALIGPAGESLQALRGWARNRAVSQAIKEVNAPMIAGREAKAAAVARDLPVASAAKREAAAATRSTIRGSDQSIDLDELVDRIVADREARVSVTGAKASPKTRASIAKDVRARIAQVLPNFSGKILRVPGGKVRASALLDASGVPIQRAEAPPQLTLTLPKAQVAKQAFDSLVRSAHGGIESGIAPRPDIDLDIASGLRALIEEKEPAVAGLNAETQAAIKKEQGLKRLQKSIPTSEVAAARMAERDAATGARVLAQRSANPIKMFSGLPVRGGIARPGLALRPGTIAEMLGKMGDVLASQPAGITAFTVPRALALWYALNQAPSAH